MPRSLIPFALTALLFVATGATFTAYLSPGEVFDIGIDTTTQADTTSPATRGGGGGISPGSNVGFDGSVESLQQAIDDQSVLDEPSSQTTSETTEQQNETETTEPNAPPSQVETKEAVEPLPTLYRNGKPIKPAAPIHRAAEPVQTTEDTVTNEQSPTAEDDIVNDEIVVEDEENVQTNDDVVGDEHVPAAAVDTTSIPTQQTVPQSSPLPSFGSIGLLAGGLVTIMLIGAVIMRVLNKRRTIAQAHQSTNQEGITATQAQEVQDTSSRLDHAMSSMTTETPQPEQPIAFTPADVATTDVPPLQPTPHTPPPTGQTQVTPQSVYPSQPTPDALTQDTVPPVQPPQNPSALS